MLVLIADEQTLYVEALSRIIIDLASSMKIDKACTFEQMQSHLQTGKPFDLVFFDPSLCADSEWGRQKIFDTYGQRYRFIILATSKDMEPCQMALQLGVKGYIHKSSDATIVMQAIQTVLQGDIYYSSEYQAKPKTIYTEKEILLAKIVVSTRQFHTLQLMDKGFSNKEIARELGITESTVKTHVANLFQLLEARNRTHCLIQARQLHLL